MISASQSSPALADVDADDAFEAQPAAGIRTCTSMAFQTGLPYVICKQSARPAACFQQCGQP